MEEFGANQESMIMKPANFKNFIIATVALGLFIAAQTCRAEDDAAAKKITRTFTVEPGGDFSLDTDEGDIDIQTAAQPSVQIVVEREARGGSEGAQEKALRNNK